MAVQLKFDDLPETLFSSGGIGSGDTAIAYRFIEHASLDECKKLLDEIQVGNLRTSLLRSFSERYAKEDLAGACDWFLKLSPIPENWASIAPIARAASTDPNLAKSTLDEIRDPQFKEIFFLAFLGGTASTDFSTALDLLRNLEWEKDVIGFSKDKILATLGSSILPGNMTNDLDLLSEYVGNQGDMPPLVTESLTHGLLKMEPGQLEPLLGSLVKSEQSPLLVEKVAAAWAEKDPITLSELLRNMPDGPYRDRATIGLVRRITGNEPDTAMRWALNITDPSLRTQSAKYVIFNALAGRDQIVQVVRDSKLGADEKNSLLIAIKH